MFCSKFIYVASPQESVVSPQRKNFDIGNTIIPSISSCQSEYILSMFAYTIIKLPFYIKYCIYILYIAIFIFFF